MKRALITASGTVTGIAAVLLLNPSGVQIAQMTAGSAAAETVQTPSPQTYTGDMVSTRWGPVQVAVTVQDGSITAVDLVAMPSGDPHSNQITQVAGPMLVEQALGVQSADVDGVSGATYTSDGFRRSLQSALYESGL